MAKVSFTTKDGRRVSFTTKRKSSKKISKQSRKSSGQKKKKTKSVRKLTGKALAAARRNIKKAQAARRRKSSSTSKRSKGSKKMAGKKGGKKGGTSGMTRTKKFLIGLGVGTAVSTVATLARTPEIESSGPVIDALVGGGVEAQIGTAVPRLIRQLVLRSGGFGNGGNGLALEGA